MDLGLGVGAFPTDYARRGRRVDARSHRLPATQPAESGRSGGTGDAAIAINADESSHVAGVADELITLGFAEEQSVVQTRFATTTLAILRATLGHDVLALANDAEQALSRNLDPTLTEAAQITFLGRGWTVGLAHEAALKLR